MDRRDDTHDPAEALGAEKPAPDAREQQRGVEEDEEQAFPVPDEVPEADAIEQHRAVRGHGDDVRIPGEANEADAWEQALEAGEEEDDRR